MKWQVIHSGVGLAEKHMETDQHLLNNIAFHNQPILRFYDWQEPSATYGYFINPYDYLDKEELQKTGLNLARRPTGGGIVFHLTDLAFSILIPASFPAFSTNTLENYAFVNSIVSQAIVKFKKGISTQLLANDIQCGSTDGCHFCMAKPTIYDVMVDGKKVGGAAQRRTKNGFLHQGTISLTIPDSKYLKVVLNEDIVAEMKSQSYQLIDSECLTIKKLEEARATLRELLIQTINNTDNLELQ